MAKVKAAKRGRAVGVGRERAKVWVITVINPILEGMASERYWLSVKNWSWRYRTAWFERLRYIPAYLDMRYFANYEDFCTEYKEISDSFRAHDDALNVLANFLEKVYICFLGLPGLHDELQRVHEECERRGTQIPWEALGDVDKRSIIAEYVLNNLTELPSHYADAVFWKEFGERFLALRNSPTLLPLLKQVDAQGADVQMRSLEVERKLRDIRREYGRRFDIPAIPLEPGEG